jgi:hypothetical protein
MKPNFQFKEVLSLLQSSNDAPDADSLHSLVPKKHATDMLEKFMFILAHRYPLVRNDDGLISFTKTAEKWKHTDATWDGTLAGEPIQDYELGSMIRFMRVIPRGLTASGRGTQTGPACKELNSSVPLIPAAFKKWHGIGYSEWDWSDPNVGTLVDSDIVDFVALKSKWQHWYGFPMQQALLDINTRDANRNTYKMLTGILNAKMADSGYEEWDFMSLPRLGRYAALGQWVYNPENPNQYSLRNLCDMDEPFFAESAEIFEVAKPVEAPKKRKVLGSAARRPMSAADEPGLF